MVLMDLKITLFFCLWIFWSCYLRREILQFVDFYTFQTAVKPQFKLRFGTGLVTRYISKIGHTYSFYSFIRFIKYWI